MSRKRKQDKSSLSVTKSFNERLHHEENSFDLSELLKKKWRVFRVSHIYNFNSAKLKTYSNKLDEELNSRKKFLSNVNFKSRFSLNKNLRLNDQCPESLQLQILVDESQVYLGHFISWTTRKPKSEDCIFLPILLVEAKGPDLHKIHASLCKLFDCDIQPVTFSFNALVSFLVKLLETSKPNIDMSEALLMMEYKIPGCEAKDSIKLFLCLEEVVVVFAVNGFRVIENLHENVEEIANFEIIWEFYNRLLNHVYNVYRMDLVYAELQKITFPDAFMTSNGLIKMSTVEAAASCLNVLQCFTPLDAATKI